MSAAKRKAAAAARKEREKAAAQEKEEVKEKQTTPGGDAAEEEETLEDMASTQYDTRSGRVDAEHTSGDSVVGGGRAACSEGEGEGEEGAGEEGGGGEGGSAYSKAQGQRSRSQVRFHCPAEAAASACPGRGRRGANTAGEAAARHREQANGSEGEGPQERHPELGAGGRLRSALHTLTAVCSVYSI